MKKTRWLLSSLSQIRIKRFTISRDQCFNRDGVTRSNYILEILLQGEDRCCLEVSNPFHILFHQSIALHMYHRKSNLHQKKNYRDRFKGGIRRKIKVLLMTLRDRIFLRCCSSQSRTLAFHRSLLYPSLLLFFSRFLFCVLVALMTHLSSRLITTFLGILCRLCNSSNRFVIDPSLFSFSLVKLSAR